MRLLIALLTAGALAGCRETGTDESALRRRFTHDRALYERVRDEFLAEPSLPEVRLDAYSYTEPCAEWKYGCSRWVDETPTPEVLERYWHVPPAHGRALVDGLKELGALAVRRDGAGVQFWMKLSGIIPSGSTTSITWMPGGVRAETRHVWSRLDGDWYVELEWN